VHECEFRELKDASDGHSLAQRTRKTEETRTHVSGFSS
jgi:hypothetical protein